MKLFPFRSKKLRYWIIENRNKLYEVVKDSKFPRSLRSEHYMITQRVIDGPFDFIEDTFYPLEIIRDKNL